MDKDQMKNYRHIEKYLQGGLTTEEQAAFEEEYLSSGQILDELEAAGKLKQGLQDLSVVENPAVTAEQPSWLGSYLRSPQYAMAASVLLVVSLGISGVLFQKIDSAPGSSHSEIAVPTQITSLISVRGTSDGSAVNTLKLGSKEMNHVLMLDPGFSSYSVYRATVYRLDPAGAPTRIWQVNGMLPGYEDMLALSLPGSILDPGSYEIQVEGWQDGWPSGHEWEPIETQRFNSVE